MHAETWVAAGGVFSAAFAAFHLFFWRLFRWKTELAKLTSLNRAIVQVLNLCLTFVFVIFAYVSLMHRFEMVASELGKALLLLIALFWYLRAAEQIVLFGLRSYLSVLFLALFVLGGSFYAVPLFQSAGWLGG